MVTFHGPPLDPDWSKNPPGAKTTYLKIEVPGDPFDLIVQYHPEWGFKFNRDKTERSVVRLEQRPPRGFQRDFTAVMESFKTLILTFLYGRSRTAHKLRRIQADNGVMSRKVKLHLR